jgi:hypothetical protein
MDVNSSRFVQKQLSSTGHVPLGLLGINGVGAPSAGTGAWSGSARREAPPRELSEAGHEETHHATGRDWRERPAPGSRKRWRQARVMSAANWMDASVASAVRGRLVERKIRSIDRPLSRIVPRCMIENTVERLVP